MKAIIYIKILLAKTIITNSKLNWCLLWANHQENKHVENANIQQQTSPYIRKLIFSRISSTKHLMPNLKIKLHKYKQRIILICKQIPLWQLLHQQMLNPQLLHSFDSLQPSDLFQVTHLKRPTPIQTNFYNHKLLKYNQFDRKLHKIDHINYQNYSPAQIFKQVNLRSSFQIQ